mmetsp:Transcript_87280/g.151877  ORF Transcript_87280/g.151877 Transcript_87280/m.151877 type:complete len:156 (-) Transcript_87280:435-902(-)
MYSSPRLWIFAPWASALNSAQADANGTKMLKPLTPPLSMIQAHGTQLPKVDLGRKGRGKDLKAITIEGVWFFECRPWVNWGVGTFENDKLHWVCGSGRGDGICGAVGLSQSQPPLPLFVASCADRWFLHERTGRQLFLPFLSLMRARDLGRGVGG